MNQKSSVSVLLFLFLHIGLIHSQVWPGDINNNGIVNAVDVLYFSLANGAEGPARSDRGLDWRAQNLDSLWGQSFPDGINYAFADCNGDGKVDLIDQLIISINQHETHGVFRGEEFSEGLPGTAPPLQLDLRTANNGLPVVAGSTVEIPLILGTEDLPVADYSGLAFHILIDTAGLGLEVQPTVMRDADDWLRDDAGLLALNAEPILKPEGTVGLSVAHFLFDPGEKVDGFGPIAKLQLIIEEDLTLIQGSRNVDVIVEPIRMIDPELNNLNLVGDTIALRIFADSTHMLLVDEEGVAPTAEPLIEVFPNPAQREVRVQTPTGLIAKIQLSTPDGSTARAWAAPAGKGLMDLRLEGIPPGTYFLQVQLDSGGISTTLLIITE